MKPYPEYVDSRIGWLGKIPKAWGTCKLKHLADLRSGDSLPTGDISDDGEFPVYGGNGLRGYTKAHTHEGAYVLIGRQGALCGNINYAEGRFWATEHAVVVSPKRPIDTQFMGELLRVMNLNQYSESAAQPGLAVSKISNLVVPDVPFAEQERIGSYLRYQMALIDQLIAKNEQLITLLDDQRKAIINEAVTKGLDPKAPMKDSGVEWLGEVPKGWAVGTLKHLLDGKLTYGANEAADEDNPDDPRYIRITDFDNDGRLRSDTYRSLPPAKAQDYLLEVGDVLFARSGATVGKTFMYTDGSHEACFAGYLIRARCDRSVLLPEFLYLFTKSTNYENWKNSVFNQATIQNIGADKYAQLVLPLPTTAEQEEIIAYLEKVDGDIQRLRDLVIDQGKTLEEYRQSLISEAVTGKIDLREWVPAPQQTVEP